MPTQPTPSETVSPGWFDLGEPPSLFEVSWQGPDGKIITNAVKAFNYADAAWRVSLDLANTEEFEGGQLLDVIRLS